MTGSALHIYKPNSLLGSGNASTAGFAQIKREWRSLVDASLTAQQMTESVAQYFAFLDDDVASRLVVRYCHYSAGGKPSWKELPSQKKVDHVRIRGNGDPQERALTVADLVLQVKYKPGDEVMEDVNCDSQFMLENMDSIGRATREAHHWILEDYPIFLIMDNAGGHGTHDAIDKYVSDLWDKHRVEVIHQVPRGPELNRLDLGAWMSLQSAVEKQFRGSRNDSKALVKKIEETWALYDSSIFYHVYERWGKVLQLVIDDKGDNRMVESNRGKLFSAADENVVKVDDDSSDEDDSSDDEDSASDSDSQDVEDYQH